MQLEAYQIRDLVIAPVLVKLLASEGHPLMLPLAPGSRALVDFSEVTIQLPVRLDLLRPSLRDVPILRRVWELTVPHESRFPDECSWRHSFFYLEVLARGGRHTPLCWINKYALYRHAWLDPLQHEAVSEDYQALLTEGWAKYAEELEARGALRFDWPEGWTEGLDFSLPLAETGRTIGHGLSSGLHWRWFPVYDRKVSPDLIRRCMLEELYLTSIFNRKARGKRLGDTWATLRERFLMPYRGSQQRDDKLADREDYVALRLSEGAHPRLVAQELLDTGLYPLYPHRRWKGEKRQDLPDLEDAVRTVYRIRAKLAASGRLPAQARGEVRGRPAISSTTAEYWGMAGPMPPELEELWEQLREDIQGTG